jgi:hypothetical protein
MADLEAALYNAQRGVGSNRKFRPGGICYRHTGVAAAGSTAAMTLGTVYAVPFEVGFTTAFASILCEATVAGTTNNVTMGIYADDSGKPGAKLGEVTAAANAIATIEGALPITLSPGMYWLAIISLGGVAPTIRTWATHNNPLIGTAGWSSGNNNHYDLAAQPSLPATFPTPSIGGGTACPMLQLKTV